jgi:hypothetical protein
MFRGTELPRLLVLLAVMTVGWVLVWRYVYSKEEAPADDPGVVVGDVLAPIKPEASPEFESVTDKRPVELRDTAAYVKLLERARETGAAELAAKSRRDVFFSHLWQDPKAYRGVPVHLLGTAFRIVHEPSKKTRSGWLYTAWIVTPESSPNPYACVFEDAPKDLPLGDKLSERVVFNGYFLKLLAYQAHDKERAAPMLIGRIGWTPKPPAADHATRPITWMALAIGVMFLISFFRWITSFRRSLSVHRRPSLLKDRPTEEISPEDLATYLQNVEDQAPHSAGDPRPEE